ncbi:MAG: CRTAC1 family protein, partial [Acidobacteriota bacterium]
LLGGDEDAAIAHWETALALAPWEASWRRRLARILRARGERNRAEAVLAAGPDIEGPALPVHTGRIGTEGKEGTDQAPREVASVSPYGAEGAGWWTDVSGEVGLDFMQYDGRSGRRYYVETTGSGCGFLDFDDDGDLDVYLLTGAPTPGSPPQVETPRNALFENREGRFVEVTDEAGVGDDGFGMGMCVGDVDGDGLMDFLVANYGPDRLYRNLGGGRFEEIGQQAGVDDSRWSSNCAFGDIDGDGDLDLFVSHYLEAGFDNNPFCGDRARNISAYCRPSVFPGVSDSLFINSGDGTFTGEGERRGLLQGELEKGFGVVLTDLDDDGDLDIFVANDSTPNRLYINDGKGYFDETGLFSGLGLNGEGMPTSGMGADIGDVDGDGLQDVVLTNYAMESNGLYRNLGEGVFEDVCSSTGIAAASRPEVGWGARLADFDNDGDLDLAIANGHVVDNITLFEPDNSYGQRNRLLLNDGRGVFSDVSNDSGEPWNETRVSRALTTGDWNNDGRLDLLIANTNDRFQLLENRLDHDHHWLGLKLVGRGGNVAAIGTRVIATAGGRTMMREVRSGTGFQSQGDLRLHFGLGDFQGPVTLEILWPDGSRQVESVEVVDRYLEVQQGQGAP